MPQSTQERRATGAVEGLRRVRIRPAYILLALLMGLFAFKFIEKTQETKGLAAREAALRQQNLALQADSARVKNDIAHYRSPQYVEEEARAAFGYTKPGDTAIQIQPVPPRVVQVRAGPPQPAAPPEPAWKQWWQSFFG